MTASSRAEPASTMPVIELTTLIRAPIERCFDLSRSIDLHVDSTAHTDERAIAGVTSGLIDLGQEVTWRATHLGVRQELTSRMTLVDWPHRFRDSMVRGAFARFDHDHIFTERDGVTEMRDVFDYTSPLGILGRIADALVVERHVRELLEERNRVIREAAESDAWRKYLAG